MGNDGGSIPTRRELVKEAARNPTTTQLKETIKEQQAFLWSTCPLSKTPLSRPIVSDSAGNLYNKDAVLQFLLPGETGTINKDDCEKILGGRVRGLKDVVEITFEVADGDAKKEGHWICPVTSKELGPAVKAVYLVPCGHAFSSEAIKEMKGSTCIQCETPYEEANIIPILPFSEDDMNRLRIRAEHLTEKGLTHALKKVSGTSKKRKMNGNTKPVQVQDAKIELLKPSTDSPAEPTRSTTPQTASGTSTSKKVIGIKNAATASLTGKVLQEEEDRKKRRKMMGENENLKTLFSQSGTNQKHKDGDFMTRGFSIPAGARRS